MRAARRAALGLGLLLATSPRPAASSEADGRFMAQLVARSFFRALVAGDHQALLPLCAERVDFDGAVAKGRAAVEKQLERIAARARARKLVLRRVVLLDRAEMQRRYGPPPARLRRSVPPGAMIALARFDRLGAVAVLARQGRFWRVVALSD